MGNIFRKTNDDSYVEEPTTDSPYIEEELGGVCVYFEPIQDYLTTQNNDIPITTTDKETTSVCYCCKNAYVYNSSNLYDFQIKDVEGKQMLCVECYMVMYSDNKVEPLENNNEQCASCNKSNVTLYTRGLQQYRVCGDCID